jgi:O-methyltransferase involved in polyketide biosynthesis
MEKVRFTEEQSTMLATLYGRAMDSRSADPILADPTAEDAVRRIDYDFAKFGMGTDQSVAITIRAKLFDDWTAEFLRDNPASTVLHLGCGMDSRVFRIDPPASVRWFDVDYPDVIDLRKQIYPEREDYTLISSSVTDLAWLDDIPADRPTLVVAEGLTMYLEPAAAGKLFRTMAELFPRGEMIFDLYGRLGIKLQKLNPIVRRAGATLTWGVDDPWELEKLGLTVMTCMDGTDFATPEIVARMSRSARLQLRMASAIPAVRRMGHVMRYKF